MRPSTPMTSTTKILDRLQRYELELLAPARVARSTRGTTVGEIRRFRASVYHEFDSLPAQDPEIADDGIDRDAWHLEHNGRAPRTRTET